MKKKKKRFRTNDVYTLRSTKASANIEYRPEFSHLVGLLGDCRHNKKWFCYLVIIVSNQTKILLHDGEVNDMASAFYIYRNRKNYRPY